MKKIIFCILIVSFCLFLNNERAHAATMNPSGANSCALIQQSNGSYFLFVPSDNGATIEIGPPAPYKIGVRVSGNNSIVIGWLSSQYTSFADALNAYNNDTAILELSNQGWLLSYETTWITILKGNVNNKQSTVPVEIYVEPTPEPTPEPSWWDLMWDWLEDDMEKPLGFIWFKNLISDVFGDDSDGTISDNVTIGNPTIAPTPTHIPYTTVVIPKTDPINGDTYYETNYYYVNPSGTPIITSSPPTNTPATGSPGYSPGSDYYPIDGDPYSLPKLDWFTSATIGDQDYDGIDSIMDGIGSIDTIGSDYTDGLSTVQDATGTLPTDWLLLIGIAAAIPLIAGIISRFLS